MPVTFLLWELKIETITATGGGTRALSVSLMHVSRLILSMSLLLILFSCLMNFFMILMKKLIFVVVLSGL